MNKKPIIELTAFNKVTFNRLKKIKGKFESFFEKCQLGFTNLLSKVN